MAVRTRKGDSYTAEVIEKYNEYRKKTSADRRENKNVDEDNARELNAALNRAAQSLPAPNGLWESPSDEEM